MTAMKEVYVSVNGFDLDLERALHFTSALAREDNPDTDLVAWFDKKSDMHSPSLGKEYECDSPGLPHWEKYAMNHGGKMKVIVNDGEYVLIYN
jgi:hypothetical protein